MVDIDENEVAEDEASKSEKKAKVKKKPGKFKKTMSFCFMPMINAKAWMGYNEVKSGANAVSDTVTQLLTVTESERTETFEEAKARLNLTDEKLVTQAETFTRLCKVFLGLSAVVLLIALYLLFTGGFYGFLLCFLLTLIGLANAFRYHFWFFQIKQQKLGCSLREWTQATLFKRG